MIKKEIVRGNTREREIIESLREREVLRLAPNAQRRVSLEVGGFYHAVRCRRASLLEWVKDLQI
jgi:uncharacterized protein YdhG (YjbR/CyaY superfamily)